MSVILWVYGNHGMRFADFDSALSQMEERLQVKVLEGKPKDLIPTEIPSAVQFVTQRGYFRERYSRDGWAHLYTNFTLCDGIQILPHFIQFYASGNYPLKTHQWKALVSGKMWRENPEQEREIAMALLEWNKTRAFMLDITRRLGGEALLYLNDGAGGLHEAQAAMFENGGLPEVLENLAQVSEGVPYQELVKGTTEYTDYNWFMEQV